MITLNSLLFFFLKNKKLGTRLCFHKGRNKEWIDVEDFAGLASCRNEADDSVGAYKVSSEGFFFLLQFIREENQSE